MNDIGKESHRSQVIAGIAVSTNKAQRLTRASVLHWRVASVRFSGFKLSGRYTDAERKLLEPWIGENGSVQFS